MNYKHNCWHFQSAIPENICNDIIKLANEKKIEKAVTGNKLTDKKIDENSEGYINNLKKVRDSNVTWLEEPWIYNEIIPYIERANANARWNFDWDFLEQCQFTRYKKGQFYDWHRDSFDEPNNKPSVPLEHNKIRKLSVTLNLTDPKEYTGGELEFDFQNTGPGKKPETYICKEILPKGSLVVFPSYIWHRVKPVTSGERNSLVIWNLGYSYR